MDARSWAHEWTSFSTHSVRHAQTQHSSTIRVLAFKARQRYYELTREVFAPSTLKRYKTIGNNVLAHWDAELARKYEQASATQETPNGAAGRLNGDLPNSTPAGATPVEGAGTSGDLAGNTESSQPKERGAF